nr:BspA family leucine-rich repeat surface protein [Mycoplasmopsis bovis]
MILATNKYCHSARFDLFLMETQYEGDVATTIGYDDKGKIKKFRSSTNKVPEHLPKFISSLESAFAESTQEKIENLDKWDTSNISDFNTVFRDANKFNHDISRWKTDSAKINGWNVFWCNKFWSKHIKLKYI